MFLVDDILLSPVRGLIWVAREIQDRALEESQNESENITQQLRNLYMQLETGRLSEPDFDQQEKVLLDRLDDIENTEAEAAVARQ